MAKSIYDTLASETFAVDHGTETHEFITPTWLSKFTVEVMQSEEELMELAMDEGIMHGLLHLGLQQAIIALRAKYRPTDKKGEKQSMLADIPGAEARGDSYLPKPIPVPGKAKPVSQSAAIAALKAAGITKEQLMAMFE